MRNFLKSILYLLIALAVGAALIAAIMLYARNTTHGLENFGVYLRYGFGVLIAVMIGMVIRSRQVPK